MSPAYVLSIPNTSINGKNTSEASEKKNQKKKIIVMRLQIGTTTTRTEIIRIKRMFIILTTA